MQENQFELDSFLEQSWLTAYSQSQEIFRSNLDNIEMKKIGKYVAYYNDSHAEAKNQANQTFLDFTTLELDEKDLKTPIVYQDYDENQDNFNNKKNNEILFYVDLDEEEIITKNEAEKKDIDKLEQNEEYLEQEISENQLHPIFINMEPICPKDCLLPLFPKEEMPQVIGQDIIILIFQLFRMSKSPYLRIGFNSIGGYATINHLHFQLLYVDDIISKEKKFPIESCEKVKIFSSSLQNLKQDEINMYNVGITIQKLKDYPVNAFVVIPDDSNNQDFAEISSSLSFVTGTITNILLDLQIPHNIMISDKGTSVYIIPRQYEKINPVEQNIAPTWIEIAGFAVCKSKDLYQKIDEAGYENILKNYVSLSNEQFDQITQMMLKLFKQKFQSN